MDVTNFIASFIFTIDAQVEEEDEAYNEVLRMDLERGFSFLQLIMPQESLPYLKSYKLFPHIRFPPKSFSIEDLYFYKKVFSHFNLSTLKCEIKKGGCK